MPLGLQPHHSSIAQDCVLYWEPCRKLLAALMSKWNSCPDCVILRNILLGDESTAVEIVAVCLKHLVRYLSYRHETCLANRCFFSCLFQWFWETVLIHVNKGGGILVFYSGSPKETLLCIWIALPGSGCLGTFEFIKIIIVGNTEDQLCCWRQKSLQPVNCQFMRHIPAILSSAACNSKECLMSICHPGWRKNL